MTDLVIRLSKTGELQLMIPSASGNLAARALEIPSSVEGLRVIKKILQDRMEAPVLPRIAEPGSPTREQVLALIRGYVPEKKTNFLNIEIEL